MFNSRNEFSALPTVKPFWLWQPDMTADVLLRGEDLASGSPMLFAGDFSDTRPTQRWKLLRHEPGAVPGGALTDYWDISAHLAWVVAPGDHVHVDRTGRGLRRRARRWSHHTRAHPARTHVGRASRNPDDATAVLKHLIALDPDGWGWNVNKRGRRWFVAPAHIDLLTVIEQVTGPGRAREVGFTTPDSELT